VAEQDIRDKRREIAQATLGRLTEIGIPPSPPHFAVWYSYFAGDVPDLRREADAMMATGQPVTEEQSFSLYDRFLRGRDAIGTSLDFSERIKSNAEQVLEALDAAGSGAKRYGKALENFSGGVAQAEGGDELSLMIKGILSETRTMEQHNQKLRAQVEESSREIEDLRDRLEDARRDALTDTLTGLANRMAFDRALADNVAKARESGDTVSLMMCDLDHFKRVNDEFGHPVGDQVLRLVGQTLVQCVKGQDIAARYGGEEFAVILPHTNVMGAAAVAEFVRRSVASKKIVRKGTGEKLGAITLSLGVAALLPGETPEMLVERADRALYGAKEGGRNRVQADKGVRLQDVANG
jgi:diguanylate cyclase